MGHCYSPLMKTNAIKTMLKNCIYTFRILYANQVPSYPKYSYIAYFSYRYVVWVDSDYSAPKIMRADLTGENHQQLYTTFHGLPLYAITNHSENRVYWTDIHLFYTFIASIGIDSSAYQGLGYLHPPFFPFGLAIFQSNLYWADQNFQGVSWFNFKSSSPTVYTRQNLSPYFLLGVTISDPSTQPNGMLKKVSHFIILVV